MSQDVPARKQYPSGLKLATILLSLALGTLLVAIDTTIISVAIPRIATQFNSINDVGWYGSAYLLTLTALQPAAGTMFKVFNPKFVYLTSMIVFEVGSILCASAPRSSVFILGRAIAGTGAAGLIQGALSTITYVAPLEKRPIYIGLIVSTFGISSCISPILGGVFTDRATWRWCFWINLPIGAVTFVLLSFYLKAELRDKRGSALSKRAKLERLDPVGVILIFGAICCLLLVLQWGGIQLNWSSSRIIGLLVGFVLLFAMFCIVQYRLGENATIPPKLLRHRTIFFGSLSSFFITMSNNTKLYYIPFYFQATRGVSAQSSGIQFLALAVPQVTATILAGAFTTKTGHYVLVMIIGEIINAIGSGFLITIDTSTPTVLWATFLALAGFGDGMAINMPFITVQATLENESDTFIGNAIATFFTLIGGAVAISIGENVLVNTLTSEITKANTGLSAKAVIDAGPVALPLLSSSPKVLASLREAYSKAVSHTNIFATVAICLSIPATLSMRWVSLKKVQQQMSLEIIEEKNPTLSKDERTPSSCEGPQMSPITSPPL